MGTAQPRRGDTRRRIQEVALKLFLEHGYEGTSLREIAERLDVTKAALYYHFKTKEDILAALADSYAAPLGEIVAWGAEQPRNAATRRELLTRYSVVVRDVSPLFTFIHENQAALRELSIGQRMRDQLHGMWDLFISDEDDLTDRARAVSALLTIHFGSVSMRDVDASPEAKRAALLGVASEIIASMS